MKLSIRQHKPHWRSSVSSNATRVCRYGSNPDCANVSRNVINFSRKAPSLALGRVVCRAIAAPEFFTDAPAEDDTGLGLLSPTGIDWYNEWYPVAFTSDLDKSRPHRFVLLDIPLAIWWDPNAAAWRVFEDVCPHRMVPLSEGRINRGGLLECGYHGWAFSGHGRCEVVPQQGKHDTPRACAVAYPAAERQGLLFVLPRPLPPALLPGGAPSDVMAAALAEAAAAEARIPVVPDLDEQGAQWVGQDTWRDLPYDWSTLMENVVDASHVPFTHHVSVSNRNKLGDFDMQLTTPVGEQGFSGVWKTGPRAGKLGPQTTRWSPPGLLVNRLEGKGFTTLLVVYAVPIRPGRCRLLNRNMFRFNNPVPETIFKLVPTWWAHVSSHLVLEDDQIFLHLGEEELARRRAAGLSHSQVCYMPSKADTYVVAFNRWVDRFGGGGPFGGTDAGFVEAIGPRLSRQQLLDRYTQHTENCATCQKGLKQVAAARTVASIVQVAAGALAIFCAAVAVTAAAGAASAGGAAAAAAVAATSSATADATAALVASLFKKAATALAGPYDPTGLAQMLRAVGWAVLAAAAALAGGLLDKLRRMFYEGVYPPLRNTKD